MHTLWGLKSQGFRFQLKGGTSLSKAFKIIDRFSEDVDIYIEPEISDNVFIGKNHDKPTQVGSRKSFFDNLAKKINIDGLSASRDTSFDDSKYRCAGIRLNYKSHFNLDPMLKDGVLLEVGFDQITPNVNIDISSWAFNICLKNDVLVYDNTARSITCYNPEYTFVEKLQAVSKKVRQQQDTGVFDTNFLRHYYDIYKLLHNISVLSFIGSDDYFEHKNKRFGNEEKDLTKNLAFNLDAQADLFELYIKQYKRISGLFYKEAPSFEAIFETISMHRERL